MQSLLSPPQTLSTSHLDARPTSNPVASDLIEWIVSNGGSARTQQEMQSSTQDASIRSYELGSTGKGILIGMLSAFGSAALVAIILAIVYFFRYTSRGKIFLDRIGRPGEYDDEQAFLREEEQALEDMDDFQRAEYSRAKGGSNTFALFSIRYVGHSLLTQRRSFCPRKSTRLCPNGHLFVAVSSNSRKGCVRMGV